jgi:hypothetical protein
MAKVRLDLTLMPLVNTSSAFSLWAQTLPRRKGLGVREHQVDAMASGSGWRVSNVLLHGGRR